MIAGQTVKPSPNERVTCIRSAQDGGDFVFEFELPAGANGPDRHSHDEGEETIEVKSGTLEVEVNGTWTTLRPGESITMGPNDVHTFRNPSKQEPVICVATAGPRFERVIEITNVLEVCYYITYVDPGASRTHDRLFKVLIPALGWIAKVTGVAKRIPHTA